MIDAVTAGASHRAGHSAVREAGPADRGPQRTEFVIWCVSPIAVFSDCVERAGFDEPFEVSRGGEQ